MDTPVPNDKKRALIDVGSEDEPAAKRKCICQEVAEREKVFDAWLLKRFPTAKLEHPCTISKITALPESLSKVVRDLFAESCPRGLNLLHFELTVQDIVTPRYRDSSDAKKRRGQLLGLEGGNWTKSADLAYNKWTSFDGLVVWPERFAHKYIFKRTATDVTTFLSGPQRVTTKVSTASRIESAHPLEQAWFDADESRNLDAKGYFDMTKCNVSSIIVPVLHGQNDMLVQVSITDEPVTRNMLISALDQVLEQSFTLEIRQLLWSAVKDADNLDAYDHNGESVHVDARQCIGDFIKDRTVVGMDKMKDWKGEWRWLKWALDCPYEKTMLLHLEE